MALWSQWLSQLMLSIDLVTLPITSPYIASYFAKGFYILPFVKSEKGSWEECWTKALIFTQDW